MSDMQNPGSGEQRSLMDSVEDLRPRLAQAGTALVTWPFYLLPQKNREEVVDATNNLFNTVGDIHLSLTKSVVDGVGSVVRDWNKGNDNSARTPTRVEVETE